MLAARLQSKLRQKSGRIEKRKMVKARIQRSRLVGYRSTIPTSSISQAAYRSTGEKKGMDTPLDLNPVIDTTNTNGSCFVLNLIRSGSGSWQRVGRKTFPKSLRLRGSIRHQYNPTATTNTLFSNALRMVVVWDKAPSGGAIPVFDQIFGTTDQAGTETCTFMDPIRYDSMDRFSVIRDCIWRSDPNLYISAAAPNNGATELILFDEYIPLKGLETVYSGQSEPMTIADIYTGAIYVYFRAQQNVAASTVMRVMDESFCRLRYTDM